LTATLAPKDEERFFRLTRLERYMVWVFRFRTTRCNLYYSVWGYDVVGEGQNPDAAFDRTVEKAIGLVRENAADGKIIIYRRTIEGVDRFAGRLTYPAFHNEIGPRKTQVLEEWVRKENLIVATNALGAGLNVPDIYAMIYAGIPRNIRDFTQESGRTGCDGELNYSIVIRPALEVEGGPEAAV
jgi:superfamily II DNA helicase RecQ